MLVHQKKMFDHYYSCHLKTLEKCFKKVKFVFNTYNDSQKHEGLEKCFKKVKFVFNTYNDSQKHEGFIGFKNACSRAKTYVILT